MNEADKAHEKEEGEPQKPSEVVDHWLKELSAAERHEKDWRDRAEKIINLYTDQRKKTDAKDSTYRFNLLYANTEVTRGALYSQCPVPDIRRRFLDKDPVSRVAATVLTRSVSTAMDRADFDGMMRDAVFDMVLPGRGVARVRYKPTIAEVEERVDVAPPMEGMPPEEGVQQDENGYFKTQTAEEVVSESVECRYVEWQFFRYSPTKRWEKVTWLAFGELLTREDLEEQFGDELAKQIDLKWIPKGMEDTEENADHKRALVWQIYCKRDRKVLAICDGYKDAPLKEIEDPLKLEAFFPSPRPLYAIQTTDSLIPVPEYTVYQDHARQLDDLNERIAVLTDAMRRRGVYDASVEELRRLSNAGDNEFVAVKNYREFSEKGGLEQAFQEMDLSNLAKVILDLTAQAEQKKAQIYELIGISDIMRGATKANETLGAQQIKNQWGNVRVGPRQAEVQRFARDAIRLMAEIIAEHFSPQTLQEMSGIELAMTPQEREILKVAAPQDPRVNRPTWEDVLRVLRSDKLRSFKIDIETDSTIRPQADEEQKNRIELITAVTGYLEKSLPAVQMGLIPKKVASEILMFGVRSFKVGPQIEEVLDEWAGGGDQMSQQPEGNPEQDAQKAEMAAAAKHAADMREIERQTALAKMVQEKAKAYQEITKGEALVPGTQLDLLMQEAQLQNMKQPAMPVSGGETLQ